jgi:hypothetical protein
MKGLALLLKSLYPKLDWSTPEATLRSLAPGIDIAQIAGRLDQGLRLMAEAANRQVRIEAMLTELMGAWEQTKAARAAAGPNGAAAGPNGAVAVPRLHGGAVNAKKRHPRSAAA